MSYELFFLLKTNKIVLFVLTLNAEPYITQLKASNDLFKPFSDSDNSTISSANMHSQLGHENASSTSQFQVFL